MSLRATGFKISAVTLLTAFSAVAGGIAPPPCIYTGRGVVAAVRVLGLGLALSDTGQLPTSGGALSAQLLNAVVPGVLSLQLLSADTTGENLRASSDASVANVNVTAAGVSITAAVLTSNANAQACGLPPSVAGSSTIVGLRVNGLSVTVTGEPNQVIPLLVGSLIINEQISSVTNSNTGNGADMLVNALHLRVLNIADVVISSSHAGLCSGSGCK